MALRQTADSPRHTFAPTPHPMALDFMRSRPALLAISGLLVAACAPGPPSDPEAPAPSGPTTIWDGVFTAAQVGSGAAPYASACSECHGNALEGAEGGPELVGRAFLDLWDGSTVYELFELTRETMPVEDPEGLPDQTYADLIAYILSANGAPPGSRILLPDRAMLEAIRIRREAR